MESEAYIALLPEEHFSSFDLVTAPDHPADLLHSFAKQNIQKHVRKKINKKKKKIRKQRGKKIITEKK